MGYVCIGVEEKGKDELRIEPWRRRLNRLAKSWSLNGNWEWWVRESYEEHQENGRRDLKEWKNQNQCQMRQDSQEYSPIKCHLIYQEVPQKSNFQLGKVMEIVFEESNLFIHSTIIYWIPTLSGALFCPGIVTENRTEKNLHPNVGDLKRSINI